MRHAQHSLGTRGGQEDNTVQVPEVICLVHGNETFGAREYETSKENELRVRDLEVRKDC